MIQPQPADPRHRMLSTEQVPVRERLDFWQDATDRLFPPTRLSCPAPDRFHGEVAWIELGAIVLADIRTDGIEVSRTAREIDRTEGDWLEIGLQLQGSCSFRQEQEEVLAAPGSILVYDSRRPYRMRFDARYRQISLKLPRADLRARLPAAERISLHCLQPDHLPSRFFADMVGRLCDGGLPADGRVAARLQEHLLELLVTALVDATADEAPGRSPSRQMQLRRIKTYLHDHLADASLTPSGIAAACGLSLRSLYELFADEPVPVSAWIQQQRLQRIRRDLADPLQAAWPVGSIALRHGFRDLSHFSRRFRAQFGVSPGAWRRDHIVS